MLAKEDQKITQAINNKLAQRGVRSPCHVTVESKNGDVTLSGTVQYAHQKGAVLGVAKGISGVRHVVDRMVIQPLGKRP